MAYGYWKLGMAQRESVFHLSFRKNPFAGGYSIACGLHSAIEFLQRLHFDESDLGYLATLRGNDDRPLFDAAFLKFMGEMRFECDVDAAPEGTAVFPHEPLVRVKGPLVQAQIVETPLLNLINFQTLIATKSARICQAAQGEPVLEFGLRRAQGIDGGLTATRSAYVGGCAGTSNLLAGKLFGIPVGGTHAHSWIMSFDDELTAFERYAEALPNNCVFLVDTYNTLEGVRHAVRVGQMLRDRGFEMIGIRLDSGDLAYLSIEARKILDEAGFQKAQILASNDLDEHIIASLKQQGATIAVWGVGTRLATAFDQPALGGVYKLAAQRNDQGKWDYKIKLSEQTAKISTPGILQVRRFRDAGGFIGDAIYDELLGIKPAATIVDPLDSTRRKTMPAEATAEDLLVPVFRGGTRVYDPPALTEVRQHAKRQIDSLHQTIRRLMNPHGYPVGLEEGLHDLKTQLILKARRL
jgi:nicotinate phosphoribosyltransferase